MNKKAIVLILIALLFLRKKIKFSSDVLYTVAAQINPLTGVLIFNVYTSEGWARFDLEPYSEGTYKMFGVVIDYDFIEENSTYSVTVHERNGEKTTYIYDLQGNPIY